MIPGKLSNLKVLLTRQDYNNHALALQIAANGGQAIELPLLAVESLVNDKLLAKINNLLASCSLCVCISRNAAELVLPQIKKPEQYQWATIGPATAQYLREYGCDKVLHPEQSPFDSAALLGTLEKHNLKLVNQYIMILTGSGGDKVLQNALSKLGAMVELIPIYNRVMPAGAREQFINIFNNAATIDIILITCITSLANLICLARVAQIMVCKLPLLVVSQRIYEYAIAHGFQSVYVAKSMTEESILIALENYRCINAKNQKI